jgi:hypothetical protein
MKQAKKRAGPLRVDDMKTIKLLAPEKGRPLRRR